MTIDIAKLRALAEAATPGPWYAENERYEGAINTEYRHIGMVSMFAKVREDIPQNFANQDFIAAANPATVLAVLADFDQLKAENEALRDAAAVSAMRIKELDLLFGRYILAMRAAVIEDEHGTTETTGMDWIFNSLAGPGELPPEDETDAQAYFDRQIIAVDNGMQEVMAFHEQRRKAKSKDSGHD